MYYLGVRNCERIHQYLCNDMLWAVDLWDLRKERDGVWLGNHARVQQSQYMSNKNGQGKLLNKPFQILLITY